MGNRTAWLGSQLCRSLGFAAGSNGSLFHRFRDRLTRTAAVTKQSRWQQQCCHQYQYRTEPDNLHQNTGRKKSEFAYATSSNDNQTVQWPKEQKWRIAESETPLCTTRTFMNHPSVVDKCSSEFRISAREGAEMVPQSSRRGFPMDPPALRSDQSDSCLRSPRHPRYV